MLTPQQVCDMEKTTGISADTIRIGLGLAPQPKSEPISTFEEALKKYRHVPHGGPEEAELILSWLALCATAKQARVVFHYAPNKSIVQSEALLRWRQLSAAEIERATNLAETCDAQADTPHKSPESLAAIHKRLSFCTSLAEMLEAGRSVPCNSKEKVEVIKKIATLFVKQ